VNKLSNLNINDLKLSKNIADRTKTATKVCLLPQLLKQASNSIVKWFITPYGLKTETFAERPHLLETNIQTGTLMWHSQLMSKCSDDSPRPCRLRYYHIRIGLNRIYSATIMGHWLFVKLL